MRHSVWIDAFGLEKNPEPPSAHQFIIENKGLEGKRSRAKNEK